MCHNQESNLASVPHGIYSPNCFPELMARNSKEFVDAVGNDPTYEGLQPSANPSQLYVVVRGGYCLLPGVVCSLPAGNRLAVMELVIMPIHTGPSISSRSSWLPRSTTRAEVDKSASHIFLPLDHFGKG